MRASKLRDEIEQLDLRVDGLSGSPLIAYEGQALKKLQRQAPSVWAVVSEKANDLGLSPIRVLINSIPPGHRVPTHTDAGPRRLRLHYPVTVPVHIWDEVHGNRVFEPNQWSHEVPYWVPHTVWNPYDDDRINVIVDFS